MKKKYVAAAIILILIVGGGFALYLYESAYRSNPYGAKEIDPKHLSIVETMNDAVGIPTEEEVFENIMSGSSRNLQPLPEEEAIQSAKELMIQKYPDPLDASRTSWDFVRAEKTVNRWEIHFSDSKKSKRAAVIFGKFGEAEILLY